MLEVYLYQDETEKKRSDYAWQHETGQRLLAWVKGQKERSAQVFYNITHSGKTVAVAAAGAPVGVDVENRRSVSRRVAERILSEREQLYLRAAADHDMAFLQLWTLKECYGKALGIGLLYPLKQVEFIPQGLLHDCAWQSVSCTDARMRCFSLLRPDDVLSVCCQSVEEEKPFLHILRNIPRI